MRRKTTDQSAFFLLQVKYMRLIYEQLYPYFDNIFSKFQCGFHEDFIAQHCQISMTEKSLYSDGQSSALLTNLFKTFECIGLELLLPKPYAYGVYKNSLYFVHSYSSQRKQRSKINTFYSTFGDLQVKVPFLDHQSLIFTCATFHMTHRTLAHTEYIFRWFKFKNNCLNSSPE